MPSADLIPSFGRGFVQVKIFTGSAVVGASATKLFVQSNLGNAMEGYVAGIGFFWQPQDLQTSPITLVSIGAQGGLAATSSGHSLCDPFTVPLSRSAPSDVFWFPPGYGIPFQQGTGVGLQITNNEGSSYYVEGKLILAYWPADQRRESEARHGPGQGAPWVGPEGRRLFP